MRPSTPHRITVPQLGTAPKTNMFHLKINPYGKGHSFQRNPWFSGFQPFVFTGRLRTCDLFLFSFFSVSLASTRNSPPNNSPYLHPPKTKVTRKCFSPWKKRETSTIDPSFTNVWGGNLAVSFSGACVISGVLTNSTCGSEDPPKSPRPTSCLTLITKHPNQQWPASIDFSSTPGCNKNSQRQNDSDKGHVEIRFSSILIIKSHYIL